MNNPLLFLQHNAHQKRHLRLLSSSKAHYDTTKITVENAHHVTGRNYSGLQWPAIVQ